MTYKINYDCDLEKAMTKIPKRDQSAIVLKIKSLAHDPRQDGAIKLKGKTLYRLRGGRYRIIYDIRDKELVVIVVDVDARKDAYKMF